MSTTRRPVARCPATNSAAQLPRSVESILCPIQVAGEAPTAAAVRAASAADIARDPRSTTPEPVGGSPTVTVTGPTTSANSAATSNAPVRSSAATNHSLTGSLTSRTLSAPTGAKTCHQRPLSRPWARKRALLAPNRAQPILQSGQLTLRSRPSQYGARRSFFSTFIAPDNGNGSLRNSTVLGSL